MCGSASPCMTQGMAKVLDSPFPPAGESLLPLYTVGANDLACRQTSNHRSSMCLCTFISENYVDVLSKVSSRKHSTI